MKQKMGALISYSVLPVFFKLSFKIITTYYERWLIFSSILNLDEDKSITDKIDIILNF